MSDMLTKLYAAKAAVLADEEAREPLEALRVRAEARRGERRSLAGAIRGAAGPALIAEIKRASPTQGLIARNFDPAATAATYDAAGADAISVLTESDHFLGELGYLDVARAKTKLPILRKDFLTKPYQIVQSAAHGADAVLLIVAGLDDATLRALVEEARRWGLDVLIEVHDETELARAVAAGAVLLGINNRDLRTFETDLGTTEHLLPFVPPGLLAISESGLGSGADIGRLHALGARGFLVGAALMRADDPAELVAAIKRGEIVHSSDAH
jgi:indole-3-glycerol phosphate synthase